MSFELFSMLFSLPMVFQVAFWQVDESGAGLELTPHPHGFLIEKVFEEPGQKPGAEETQEVVEKCWEYHYYSYITI